MNMDTKPPAIAIVGPTASGKTALSITIAKHFNGEIISADSRQVYRGMDLGSGKVTFEEMAGIPHHLLDIADPKKTVYNAANFLNDAQIVLKEITNQKKLPIVAGGTFFYLDLLQGKMGTAPVPPNHDLRAELEKLNVGQLTDLLKKADPEYLNKIDTSNPRRLIRSLEIIDALGFIPDTSPTPSPYRWLTIGIDISLDTLKPRIKQRVIDRLELGMIDEVKNLHQSGLSYERLDSFGLEYRYIAKYLQDELSYEELIDTLVTKTRQFAKRQQTWLKRDKNIVWLPFPVDSNLSLTKVEDFIKIKV